MRMTELRMMMPSSAMTPRMATKPNGDCVDQQRGGRTDQPERTGEEDQHRLAEMLQLHHQEHHDDDQHDRRLGGDRCLAFGRILGAALDGDRVARRQLVAERLQLCVERGRDVVRLHVVGHRGAHRDRRQAVAAPLDAGLERRHDLGELRDRHRSRRDRSAHRSSSTAESSVPLASGWRSTIEIVSSPSRKSPIGAPDRLACSTWRMRCEETPKARARSWSMTSFIVGTGSSQSSCTADEQRLGAEGVADLVGDLAHLVRDPGPTTRICTGQPVGGPRNRRSTL